MYYNFAWIVEYYQSIPNWHLQYMNLSDTGQAKESAGAEI